MISPVLTCSHYLMSAQSPSQTLTPWPFLSHISYCLWEISIGLTFNPGNKTCLKLLSFLPNQSPSHFPKMASSSISLGTHSHRSSFFLFHGIYSLFASCLFFLSKDSDSKASAVTPHGGSKCVLGRSTVRPSCCRCLMQMCWRVEAGAAQSERAVNV